MSQDIASLYIKIDSKGVVTASKDLDSLTNTSQRTEKATASMNKSFSDQVRILKQLAAAYGAYKIAAYIKDITMLAARYETLGVVMHQVGNVAGYTSKEMDNFQTSLEKTGISMTKSRSVLTKMLQAQLDLNQATKLGRIAQDAAVIGNINSSEAFERMIYGIQSAQIEMLRTIGINVNFENAYNKVAKASGRVAASLSESEKAQIRMNVVMEAGKGISGTYEASMTTAGKQVLSFERHIENLKVLMGKLFTPALALVIEQITESIKGVNNELSGDSSDKIEDWGNNFRLTIIDIEAEIMRLSMFIDKVGGTMSSAAMLIYGPGTALGIKSSTERFEKMAQINMDLEKRYLDTETKLQALADKRRDIEESMTPAAKARAKAEQAAAEAKIVAEQKVAIAAQKALEDQEKLLESTKKLREQWDEVSQSLNEKIQLSGLNELDAKILQIQFDAQHLKDQFKDLPESIKTGAFTLIDKLKEISVGQAKTDNLEKVSKSYEQLTASIDPVIERSLKMAEAQKVIQTALELGIITSEKATEVNKKLAESYEKEAADKLLQDKMTLYKDLAGFEDEYRQLQLEWIYKIRDEEIAATGDITAANKKASEQVAKIKQAEFEAQSSRVDDALGQMAATFQSIGNMYDKSSSEYGKMQSAAKAMIVLQQAVAVATAVAAIANQGLGDPYTAFARIAAMAAAMGGLLASAGLSLGGGSSAAAQAKPKSTVLGAEDGAGSESIKNSYQLLEDTYSMEYRELSQLNDSMNSLNRNISGLVANVLQLGIGDMGGSGSEVYGSSYKVGKMFDAVSGYTVAAMLMGPIGVGINYFLNKITGDLTGKIFSEIFGGKVTTKVTESGLSMGSSSVSGLSSGAGVDAQAYALIKRVKDGGWFKSDKTTFSTQYQAIGSGTQDLLSSIYQDISTTLISLTKEFGSDMSKTMAYTFASIDIDLKDMTGEEIDKKLSEYFSGIGDKAVETLFGSILKGYQQVGEGLLETAVRLIRDKAVIVDMLEKTGQAFTGTIPQVIAFGETIIDLAGGIDNLQDSFKTFYNEFVTEIQQQVNLQNDLTGALSDINAILPATRAEYANMVKSLDLTTNAGKQAYVVLLGLSEGAAAYYKYIENLQDEQISMQIELLEAQGKTSEALALSRQKELDAMDATLQALQKQIYAQQDLNKAISGAISVIDDQISASQTAASTARSNADNYREITETLKTAIDEIRGIGTKSGSNLKELYAKALTGDATAMSGLPDAAKSYLESSMSTAKTSADYKRIEGQVLQMLDEARKVSINETNWAEYQAGILDIQTGILKEIKETLQAPTLDTELLEQQLGLLGTISGLLSNQEKHLIIGNATQAAIQDISGLNSAYSEGMLKALIESATLQDSSLVGILDKNTEIASLLNQIKSLISTQAQIEIVANAQAEADRLAAIEAEKKRAEDARKAAEASAAAQAAAEALARKTAETTAAYNNQMAIVNQMQAQMESLYTSNGGSPDANFGAYVLQLQAVVDAAIAEAQRLWQEIPGHASGLNRVPYDNYLMKAHKDEAILTAPEAQAWRSGGSSKVAYIEEFRAMKKELSEIKQELKAGNYQLSKNTGKMANILNRFDNDGLPAERTV
jgi:hypothetical protein